MISSPGESTKEPSRVGVFLDRDGVINVYNSNYIRSLDDFIYYDHTAEAFRQLGQLGLPVVVVTNQSGIARGYQPESEVIETHRRLVEDARGWGVEIASVEYCPHGPDEGCRCRKPGPLMFERGAERAGIELSGSFMVGDSPSDMKAGRALEMTTIRVETGRGAESAAVDEDYREPDFLAAVKRIAALVAGAPNSPD